MDNFKDLSDRLKKSMIDTAQYQNCSELVKSYPIMKQKWSHKLLLEFLYPVLRPLFNFYFKKYDIDVDISGIITQYAIEEIFKKITTKLKKIFYKMLGRTYHKKLDNRLFVVLNFLTSYYHKESYRLGYLKIEDHSYLDSLNVNFGEDLLYFYLGRGVNQQLILSLNGPINAQAQIKIFNYFLNLMQLLIDNPNLSVKDFPPMEKSLT